MRAIKYLGLAAIAGAALAASSPASAQLFLQEPNFPTGPISGSEALVGIPLPDATSDEFAAHLLWNLRAGLNVAALQCQFSPYLRVVDNYNGILAHHSTELMGAYSTVGAYFKRKHGAREGQRLFVLAHELGHVMQGHWSQMGRLFQKHIPDEVVQEKTDAVAGALGRDASRLSHEQEFEADAFALHTIANFGEPRETAIEVFRVLPMTQDTATHPGTRKRVAHLRVID